MDAFVPFEKRRAQMVSGLLVLLAGCGALACYPAIGRGTVPRIAEPRAAEVLRSGTAVLALPLWRSSGGYFLGPPVFGKADEFDDVLAHLKRYARLELRFPVFLQTYGGPPDLMCLYVIADDGTTVQFVPQWYSAEWRWLIADVGRVGERWKRELATDFLEAASLPLQDHYEAWDYWRRRSYYGCSQLENEPNAPGDTEDFDKKRLAEYCARRHIKISYSGAQREQVAEFIAEIRAGQKDQKADSWGHYVEAVILGR